MSLLRTRLFRYRVVFESKISVSVCVLGTYAHNDMLCCSLNRNIN